MNRGQSFVIIKVLSNSGFYNGHVISQRSNIIIMVETVCNNTTQLRGTLQPPMRSLLTEDK